MKNLMAITMTITMALTPHLVLGEDPFSVDPAAKEMFEKGIAEFKSGNMEAASTHARIAWKKDKAVLGLDDQGMMDGFDKYLKAEIKQSPEDTTDYYRLAKLNAVRGMPKEAENLLNKIIKMSPGSTMAKKSNEMIDRLGYRLYEQELIAEDKEKFIKESREDAHEENIKISNKELAEESVQKEKENAAAAQDEIDSKDSRIAELEKENAEKEVFTPVIWTHGTGGIVKQVPKVTGK